MTDVEKQQAEAAEKAKAEEAKKAAEAAGKKSDDKTWSDDEVKKIIAERDKAKEKLRVQDEEKRKAEEAKAIEEGKLKEVLASKETLLAEVQAKLTAYQEAEKADRETLLSQIKDEGDKKIGSELSTANLRLYVEKISKTSGPSEKRGALGGGDGDDSPYKRKSGETYQQYDARIAKLKAEKRQ